MKPARSRLRLTARIVSSGLPARRLKRRTSIRRSSPVGWCRAVFANGDVPIWAPADQRGPADAQASFHGEQIRAELAADNPEPFWCWTANSRRNPSTRCFSSRKAGSRWYDPQRSNAGTRAGRAVAHRSDRGARLSARRGAGSFQAGATSTPISLIWAAASAAAIIRSCRFTWHWPRCFFPIVRCGLRTTVMSSFSRRIKRHAFKMRSRIGIDRTTGSISAFAADHVLDGGGLANYSASVADRRRDGRDRHLRHSQGRYHHRRRPLARRYRRLDARLRNVADDDRARGFDRRSGAGLAS